MLTQLANILADMVHTADGIRDVMADSGMHDRYVNMQGSPYDMWRAALEHAEKDGKLPVLLGVMRGRYPSNEALFDAEKSLWLGRLPPSVTPPGGSREWEAAWAQLNLRIMFLERKSQDDRHVIDSMAQKMGSDWTRFMLLVGIAAGLGPLLTVLFSNLLR